jgi:hypothetical protein
MTHRPRPSNSVGAFTRVFSAPISRMKSYREILEPPREKEKIKCDIQVNWDLQFVTSTPRSIVGDLGLEVFSFLKPAMTRATSETKQNSDLTNKKSNMSKCHSNLCYILILNVGGLQSQHTESEGWRIWRAD